MIEHKCHKDGCTAGARWSVHLHVRCPEPGGVAHQIGMKATIEVCDDHKEEARAYVLAPQNREIVTAGLMDNGYHEPEWMTARVEFVPIEHDPIVVIQPCDREGCTGHGRWRIKQKFRQIGERGKPKIESMTNFVVCDLHRALTRPEHLLEGELRKHTFEWLQSQGVLMPDLDRTELEFVPLNAK